MKKLNIILMGKKSWSAKALEYILAEGHRVVAVVGRKPAEELDSSKGSLLETAKQNGILTPQPAELYDWIHHPEKSPVSLENVDLVISYLFWQKVKEPLLSLPRLGAVNFHPAPLPDYRGLGGYNAAILDNRTTYGVTAHFMNEKIDEGEIIEKRMFAIDKENETAMSLEMKSQKEMFELFKKVMKEVAEETYSKEKYNVPLNLEEGIYINREQFEAMKIIESTDSLQVIDRKIRAFWFPPYEGAKIKLGNSYYTVVNNNVLTNIAEVLN